MDNKREPGRKEFVVCNIVLAILLSVAMVSGLYEIFLMIFVPAVLAYMFVRFKGKYAVAPIVLSALIPMIFSGGLNISAALLSVPAGALIAYSVKRQKGLLHGVVSGVLGEIAGLALFFMAIRMGGGEAAVFSENMSTGFNEALVAAFEAYGVPSQYQPMMYEVFVSVLPSIMSIMLIVFSYIALVLCLMLLVIRGEEYALGYRPFTCIKADKSCAVILMAAFAASIFTKGIVAKTFVNTVIILSFFMFVCGVSTASFLIKRKCKKTLKTILYVVSAVMMVFAPTIFMLMGFADSFINIRGITPPKK